MMAEARVPVPPKSPPRLYAAQQDRALRREPEREQPVPLARTLRNPRPTLNMEDVLHGVTAGWLARVFGMDPLDVKRRLQACPSVQRGRLGHTYDLKAAASFLIKPVFDVEKYVANMKPSELPPQLQDSFWKSKINRQKYELNAGELWRTADVLEVMGEIFKSVKFTTQLWADNLELQSGLTLEQRADLMKAVDALNNDIYEKVKELRTRKRTPSSLVEDESGEIDELI